MRLPEALAADPELKAAYDAMRAEVSRLTFDPNLDGATRLVAVNACPEREQFFELARSAGVTFSTNAVGYGADSLATALVEHEGQDLRVR